jgi:chloramphenicol-sensitive protein RarD
MLRGALAAGAAFTLWGMFPAYFRLMKPVPPMEILSHRVLWSVVFLLAIVALRRQWGWVSAIRAHPRIVLTFIGSALMLGANWAVYIWAVTHEHVVDASLGYLITPLFNVLFGILLGERLRAAQWLAILLAACGVLWLTISAGQLPWIGLVIGISFSLYGLIRKIASLGALDGLTLETVVLLPVAAVVLLLPDSGSSHAFGTAVPITLLLMSAGPVTAVPLLMFAYGARRIPLSVVGLLQYIVPVMQLLLGVWLFGEAFGIDRQVAFGLIASGLVLYSAEIWWVSLRSTHPIKMSRP